MYRIALSTVFVLSSACAEPDDPFADVPRAVGLAPSPEVQPTGTVTVESSPSPCGAGVCYDLRVSACPNVPQSEGVTVKVIGDIHDPKNQGIVVFTTGGGSAVYFEDVSAYAAAVLDDLEAAGFVTAQVKFDAGWNLRAGVTSGPGANSCRPASVLQRVVEALDPDGDLPVCTTGNSGGGSAITYPLTHYGHDELYDLVLPTEAPTFSRVDIGCLGPLPGYEGIDLEYEGEIKWPLDMAWGAPGGQGPCSGGSLEHLGSFVQASHSLGPTDFDYPHTKMVVIHGEHGFASLHAQGNDMVRRVVEAGGEAETLIAPNTSHVVENSPEGAALLRDTLIAECYDR